MNTTKAPLLDFENLEDIAGCLKHRQTPSSVARRRYGNERDYDPLPATLDPFLIDVYKIEQSKAWRRLMEKTQVITGQHNAHIRMRAGHSDEVVAFSTFIAACLGLNVTMVRAIAKGHDVGHTPLGHEGESFINSILQKRGEPIKEFKHERMSAIVLQEIERQGIGLNLTHQVLEAIPQHSRGKKPLETLPDMSQEAAVVMCADKIAYISGDFSDMQRIGIPIPKELHNEMNSLGSCQRERTRSLITELCLESASSGKVSFCKSETARKFQHIKELMYRIYPALNIQGANGILNRVLCFLDKFMDCESDKRMFCIDPLLVICLMTDKDVLLLAGSNVTNIQHLQQTSIWELLPHLHNKKIDFTTLDLNW